MVVVTGLVINQCDNIFIVNNLFTVSQVLEAGEGFVQACVIHVCITQRLELVAEGRTARMFAHDQRRTAPAHALGGHDLVGCGVFQHPILMNATFMGKGVAAHNGFVGLYVKAGDGGQHARDLEQVRGFDAGVKGVLVVAGAQRHDNFFQRSVACTFANAVNGTFHLPGAAPQGCQCIGNAQPQIVMVMGGKNDLIRTGYAFAHHGKDFFHIFRGGVTNRIGDVDGGCPSFDCGFHAAAQKVRIGARPVFGRPFHIVRQVACSRIPCGNQLQNSLWLHAQLVLHMQRGGGDKVVNPLAFGWGQCLASSGNVLGTTTAGQCADHDPFGVAGNLVNRFKIAFGGHGKTRLNHIHTQGCQCFGHAQFFGQIHGKTGGLFAITQSGVKNNNTVGRHAAKRRVIKAGLISRHGNVPELFWSGAAKGLSRLIICLCCTQALSLAKPPGRRRRVASLIAQGQISRRRRSRRKATPP